VAKKHNSQALEADALHFSTDIWSSGVVLLGLICVKIYEWTQIQIFFYADSVAALGVAIIVLFVSYRLGKKAIDVLLDKAPHETIEKVQKTLATFPEVKLYHSLKVRTAGADTFIKFNIHLDPDMNLRLVHELCDNIEKALNAQIDRSEIYIHAEPQDSFHLESEIPDDL
jgi:cation diffusion facilitator family transporter